MATRPVVIGCSLLLVFSSASCVEDRHHSTSGGTATQTVAYYSIDTGGEVPASKLEAPGQGAAILLSYVAGGRWRIQAQCDTNKQGSPCAYNIEARGLDGSVANVLSEATTEGQDTVGSYPPDVAALYTSTTTEIDAMSFSTPAGGSVQFTTILDGYYAPEYLIVWVSGGVQTTLATAGEFALTPTSP